MEYKNEMYYLHWHTNANVTREMMDDMDCLSNWFETRIPNMIDDQIKYLMEEKEKLEWIKENCNSGLTIILETHLKVNFKDETDHMAFKLRWME